MIKYFVLISFIFLLGCSLDTKSGIWTQEKKVKQILNIENANQDIVKESQKRLNRDLSD